MMDRSFARMIPILLPTVMGRGATPITVTIAVDSVAGNVASMTITFSASVTGFTVGDLTISAGSLANFAGSGADYTVDWTLATGTNTMDIAADVVNEGNTAASQLELGYIVLQPNGSVEDIDTQILSAAPNNNYVSATTLNLRASYTALIKFDLSSIPVGSTIYTRRLSLYLNSATGQDQTVTLNRILAANSAWTPAVATWNYAVDGVTSWAGSAGCSQSGVDVSSTELGSFSMTTSETTGYQYIVDLDASEFALMLANNYGVRAVASGNVSVNIDSSNNGTASKRPKLEIVYKSNP